MFVLIEFIHQIKQCINILTQSKPSLFTVMLYNVFYMKLKPQVACGKLLQVALNPAFSEAISTLLSTWINCLPMQLPKLHIRPNICESYAFDKQVHRVRLNLGMLQLPKELKRTTKCYKLLSVKQPFSSRSSE